MNLSSIYQESQVIRWTQIILNSYQYFLKKDLINRHLSPQEQAETLFLAPFAVFSHGIEADPIYNYGNQVALTLWERTWEELLEMPSRLSVEKILVEAREETINASRNQGFSENVQGIRVSKTGKRYQIQDITIWNLMNEQGDYCGQAATFSQWSLL